MTQPRNIDCVLNADPHGLKTIYSMIMRLLINFRLCSELVFTATFSNVHKYDLHTQSSTKPMNKLNDVIHNNSLIIAQTVAILSLALSPWLHDTLLFFSHSHRHKRFQLIQCYIFNKLNGNSVKFRCSLSKIHITRSISATKCATRFWCQVHIISPKKKTVWPLFIFCWFRA